MSVLKPSKSGGGSVSMGTGTMIERSPSIKILVWSISSSFENQLLSTSKTLPSGISWAEGRFGPALLAEVKKSPPGPKSNPGTKPDGDVATSQTALNNAYTTLYSVQAKANSNVPGDTSVDSATLDRLKSDLNAKIKAWENASAALVKWELSQPGDNAQQAIQSLIDKVEDQLTKLRRIISSGSSIVAIADAHGSANDPNATSGNDMVTKNAYLAEPIFGVAPPDNTPPPPPLDAWTKITYSFSAAD